MHEREHSTTATRRSLLRGFAAGTLALLVPARTTIAGTPVRRTFAVVRSDAQWRAMLGTAQYAVLRQAATEPPYSSPLLNEHRRGRFACAGCSQPLFDSTVKFDSGTGWPSFWAPIQGAVVTQPDHTLNMVRTEALCGRCGGHLGHVFEDGPRPTGLRYCINGLALSFKPA